MNAKLSAILARSIALVGMVAVGLAMPTQTARAATPVYVNPDGVCAGNSPCFTTIQAAVTAVDARGTVNVAAGTYAEKLTINKPLTLTGQGSPRPIVNIPAGNDGGVTITASDVTIENIHFYRRDQAGDSNSIINIPRSGSWPEYTIAYENITFSNVLFEGGRRGAFITASNLTVKDSEFQGQLRDALYFDAVSGTTNILRNQFSGTTDSKKAILFENFSDADPGESGTVNIEDNTCAGKNNFFVYNQWLHLEQKVTLNIIRNTIQDTGSTAIDIYNLNPLVLKGKFADIVVSFNSFTGIPDGKYAVSNQSTDITVNATQNWWESDVYATVAAKIDGLVTFDPWCTNAACTPTDTPTFTPTASDTPTVTPTASDTPTVTPTATLSVEGLPDIPSNGISGGSHQLVNYEVVNFPVTEFTVTFGQDMINVPSTDANYGNSVVNPANYMLVRDNGDGFQTTSCGGVGGGVAATDTAITVDSVIYNNGGGAGPFVATLHVNSGLPLANGNYRLYVCGTTSIENLSGIKLAGDGTHIGTDSVLNFTVLIPDNSGGGGTGARIPNTGFAPDESTLIPAQPADAAYSSSNNLRLDIPALGVNVPIVGVLFKNNNWDLTWLGKNAGYLDGSAYPTWTGNTVLTGHNMDAAGAPGPFAYIKDLQIGDKIYIHFGGQIFVYEVRENQQILPTQLSTVFKHEVYSWLTLVTCEDYNNTRKSYNYRRMARAVLISVIAEK
jgi:LPXTG-site transpeptidase (sortase) family protein